MFNVETGMSPAKIVQRLTFVGRRVIQQHDHLAGEMAKQVLQEQNHLFLPDIVIEEIVVKVQPLPFRADGDAGDYGNFIPPIDMTMNRSLPYRSPRLDDVGNKQKSGLVGKY